MIQKQIDRLKFTFSKGNKPNATDFEALNGIIEYVNSEKERERNNNHLFAKIFLSQFKNDFIKNYWFTPIDVTMRDANSSSRT